MVLGLSIGLILIAGTIIILVLIHNRPAKPVRLTQPRVSSQPKATTPALDPLTIEAMRSRTYPGSTITTEQLLGDQGGYTNMIISYQSDGYKIYALESTPNGAMPSGGWPVIILDHGYINPATYQTNGPEYQQFISTFAKAGFMVIKPDFRGHGKSEGAPEGGHFSPVYAYDNLNLISSLKQYPSVNSHRIGLFAHSMGGHTALRTIVVSKDIKASVFMAGVVGSMYDIFYNWPNSPAPNDQPSALVQGKKQALIAKYGDPKANPTFWNSASAINYVGFVTGPVQVNQDINDNVVPKIFADHLVTALQNANKAVQYYTYPGDDHQFIHNRTLILQRAVAFYQSNL